jgi:hypothetical protein
MSAKNCDCGKIEHGRHHIDCPSLKNQAGANGGPAFPLPRMVYENHIDQTQVIRESAGMTLLDYFAGQALVGLLTGDHAWDEEVEQLAVLAYDQAECMLAEKAKREAKQ